MYVLCCYLKTLVRMCYFYVIFVFCLSVVLVRLSVSVQVIDWKNSSPKWPLSPFNRPFSRWTWVSRYLLKQRIMEVMKLLDWSYKSCKAPVKSSPLTNQYPTFYRPDALPVAQPPVSNQSTEGKWPINVKPSPPTHWLTHSVTHCFCNGAADMTNS